MIHILLRSVLFLTLFLLLHACGGSSGSESEILNVDEARLARPPLSASVNLRLGQTSTSGTSAVAVSAALENGESITIFNSQDGEFGIFSVVYQSSDGISLLVRFDQSGRPIYAEAADAILTFTNYRRQFVDVTFSSSGVTRELPGLRIDPNVVSFLEGDTLLEVLLGINEDVDSSTRSLLAFAFSSLRLVGCIGEEALNTFSSFQGFTPESFRSVADSSCRSPLLDGVNTVVGSSDYAQITATGLKEVQQCKTPSQFSDFRECAKNVGRENVQAAEQRLVGAFPRPSQSMQPHSSPIPSISGSPSASPSSSPIPPMDPRIGTWMGIGTPSAPVTGCNSFTIMFSVTDAGDPTCQSPVCNVVGTFNEDQGFPMLSMTGSMNDMGDLVFNGMQGSITLSGSAILMMGTSTGTFDIQNIGTCDGVITVVQN